MNRTNDMKNPMEDLNGVDQAARDFADEQGWDISSWRPQGESSLMWSAYVRGRNEPAEARGPSLAAAVRGLAMKLNTPGWQEVFPEAVPPPKAEEKAPEKTGPCLSWRTRGGTWSLMEIGTGDAMRLSNHMRAAHEQALELSDDDLLKIRELIDAALAHRKKKPDWLAGEGINIAEAQQDLLRKELMKRARDAERPGSIMPPPKWTHDPKLTPPLRGFTPAELAKVAERVAQDVVGEHSCFVSRPDGSVAFGRSSNTSVRTKDELAMMIEKSLHTALAHG